MMGGALMEKITKARTSGSTAGLGWVGLGRGLHRRQVPTASVSFPH